MFSFYCALKWKSSGLRHINKKNDLWNFHLLVGRYHSIGSNFSTLVNEELSLDFKNVFSCVVVSGKVLPLMAWWQFYSHIKSQMIANINLHVCILGGFLIGVLNSPTRTVLLILSGLYAEFLSEFFVIYSWQLWLSLPSGWRIFNLKISLFNIYKNVFAHVYSDVRKTMNPELP